MDTLTQNGATNGNGQKIRCTEVYYERTINLGQYENERIGITLAVEDGEKAADVLAKARQFVNTHAARSVVNHRP